jgi:hypothetical protein
LDLLKVLNELFEKKAVLLEDIDIALHKCLLIIAINTAKLASLNAHYAKDLPSTMVFNILQFTHDF